MISYARAAIALPGADVASSLGAWLTVVLAALVVAGALLAAWALWRTRSSG